MSPSRSGKCVSFPPFSPIQGQKWRIFTNKHAVPAGIGPANGISDDKSSGKGFPNRWGEGGGSPPDFQKHVVFSPKHVVVPKSPPGGLRNGKILENRLRRSNPPAKFDPAGTPAGSRKGLRWESPHHRWRPPKG